MQFAIEFFFETTSKRKSFIISQTSQKERKKKKIYKQALKHGFYQYEQPKHKCNKHTYPPT